LASHGFFFDSDLRAKSQIDESLFYSGGLEGGPPPGARNPMVLSGLVLAGANRPVQDVLHDDRGLLTALEISGLPLQSLELVVLSACDTGLGAMVRGEGVFGLHRAFHLAGARNVIASLWKVDDDATAALMGLFYYKMWRENKPPMLALREAQLEVYRHPEKISIWSRRRGPDFRKAESLPTGPGAKNIDPPSAARSPTKLWAGFVFSGVGQ
jgi:CHAT domain-containing protein